MNKDELLSIEKVNSMINDFFFKNPTLYILVENYPKFYKHKNIEDKEVINLKILELNEPFMVVSTKSIFDNKDHITVWAQILKDDELFWISLIYCENDESCLETSLFLASKLITSWSPQFDDRNREN